MLLKISSINYICFVFSKDNNVYKNRKYCTILEVFEGSNCERVAFTADLLTELFLDLENQENQKNRIQKLLSLGKEQAGIIATTVIPFLFFTFFSFLLLVILSIKELNVMIIQYIFMLMFVNICQSLKWLQHENNSKLTMLTKNNDS